MAKYVARLAAVVLIAFGAMTAAPAVMADVPASGQAAHSGPSRVLASGTGDVTWGP